MNRVILVTGATSGIGLETYQLFKEQGDIVYSLSRRSSTDPCHISCDVSDQTAVQEAIEYLIKKEHHIDIVVNAAGYGISGAVEYTDINEAKRQFEVNFFGMVNINKEVIRYMRQHNGGTIINISSVAGVVPLPFQTYYAASKAAINSYTQSLANELRPYHIRVTAIMPGDIKTGFTAARKQINDGDEAYQGRIARSVQRMEHDETQGMAPLRIAQACVRIARKKHPKALYSVGLSYKAVCVLVKLLPVRLANYIIYNIYAK